MWLPPGTNPFIFVVALVAADPPNPPTDPPPVIPPPDPLPPCPIACASPIPVEQPRVVVRRLATPPGDDRLVFKGRVKVPYPFDPPLDPVEVGVGIVVADAAGRHVLDVMVPGGAYDPVTLVGWKASPARGVWRYVNRSAAPPAGIAGVAIRDLSKKVPGLVKFSVDGRRGAYPVDAAALPIAGLLSLDPPTAETGQCGEASFPGPTPACTAGAAAVTCR